MRQQLIAKEHFRRGNAPARQFVTHDPGGAAHWARMSPRTLRALSPLTSAGSHGCYDGPKRVGHRTSAVLAKKGAGPCGPAKGRKHKACSAFWQLSRHIRVHRSCFAAVQDHIGPACSLRWPLNRLGAVRSYDRTSEPCRCCTGSVEGLLVPLAPSCQHLDLVAA